MFLFNDTHEIIDILGEFVLERVETYNGDSFNIAMEEIKNSFVRLEVGEGVVGTNRPNGLEKVISMIHAMNLWR